MKNYCVEAVDEFEAVYREYFESVSEAFLRVSEWLSWHESGETPLYELRLLEGSEILEKYEFLD
jgi:hypothetical protein